MSDPVTANSVGDSAARLIVLAFDLVGGEIPNLPSQLYDALKSRKVQEAIESTLNEFMLKKMTAGTVALSPKDAQELRDALLKSSGSLAGDAFLQQVEKTQEYRNVKQALADFEASFSTSPTGIWVDRNQRVLYVTGVGLLLGGAVALFATKTGGPVVNLPISLIKNKPLTVFHVGKFSLGGQMLDFQPDKRILGGGLVGTEKWEKIEVTLKLGVIATGGTAQQIQGEAILKTANLNLSTTGTIFPNSKSVALGLKLGFPRGPDGPLNIGIAAVLSGGTPTGAQLNAELKAPSGNFGFQGQASQKEYRGMFTFSTRF